MLGISIPAVLDPRVSAAGPDTDLGRHPGRWHRASSYAGDPAHHRAGVYRIDRDQPAAGGSDHVFPVFRVRDLSASDLDAIHTESGDGPHFGDRVVRQSVVLGTSVTVRVDLGGRRTIK